MFRLALWKTLKAILGAAIAFWLMTRLGPWRGLGVLIAGAAVACGLGWLLLRTAPLGRANWKNYIGGYLLPFGYTLGRGQLPGIALFSWIGWSLIGLAVAVALTKGAGPSEPVVAEASVDLSGWVMPLLLTCWAILAACGFYCVSMMGSSWRHAPRSIKPLSILLAIILALFFISTGLWMADHPRVALAVVGVPIGFVGGIFALLFGIFIIFGRNMRWN